MAYLASGVSSALCAGQRDGMTRLPQIPASIPIVSDEIDETDRARLLTKGEKCLITEWLDTSKSTEKSVETSLAPAEVGRNISDAMVMDALAKVLYQ